MRETLRNYLLAERNGMTVEHRPEDKPFVGETLDGLLNAQALLADYFDLHGRFPVVRAILTPNRSEFDWCIADVLGIRIEVPSNPVRVAQPQRTDLVLLSPQAYDATVSHYSSAAYGRLILHEVTHIVEEYLSPNIEAIPRWWSEGLAIYLSGQWEEEMAEVLRETRAGKIPGMADMRDGAITDASVQLCYVWGWTVVSYVETALGRIAVRRVVEECADGNVFAILGQQLVTFEQRWKEWLTSFGENR